VRNLVEEFVDVQMRSPAGAGLWLFNIFTALKQSYAPI
jgi:hypothetical protein